jgi:predicted SAM-dependent methyltransferase
MFEHCYEWQDAIYQMKKSLVVGGWIIITTRSPGYPRHDFPGDYWRFTPDVIQAALSDFEEVEVTQDPGYVIDEGNGSEEPFVHLQPGVFVKGKRGGEVSDVKIKTHMAPQEMDENNAMFFDPIIREIESGLKLDIGSGGPTFERKDMTWTTVDKYCPADVQADMADLPYADETVDAIWSAHALEHVEYKLIMPTLAEWYRVLKRGGTCTVLVPDFDYAARMWLSDGPTKALGYVFGSQAHEGEFHKMAWNLESLQDTLMGAGFEITKAESIYTPAYTQDSLWVEAIKP